MKSILILQNLGAGEIIILALVFFFIFFIVRSINAATEGRKGNGKVLRKSDDRIICGVCGGIAEYLGVSTLLVRLVFLFTGIGIGAYLIMAIIMSE